MSTSTHKVRTPIFPLYSTVRQLLAILPGVPKAQVTGMISAIHEQMGTPQKPVDWTDPDSWIPDRLSGADRQLAQRIWDESAQQANPRHIYGAYLLINTYRLLVPDAIGVYQTTDRGKAFLNGEEKTVREVDDAEGLPQLLKMLASRSGAKRGDLIQEWGDFLHEFSKFGTPSTITDTLWRRLLNLVERGLATREGSVYGCSPKGVTYLKGFPEIKNDPRLEVTRLIETYNTKQREALREKLAGMPPYQFEHLIRDLLQAMGYEDVTVTKESGDKGVDVVATIQFGITTITEVVQVKRQSGSIGRPILDQLRGALPYHKAIRGTLITLGKFSSGCAEAALFSGAAPITLIDGNKVLDLLIEHQIGIKKRPVSLLEIDQEMFTPSVETDHVEDSEDLSS